MQPFEKKNSYCNIAWRREWIDEAGFTEGLSTLGMSDCDLTWVTGANSVRNLLTKIKFHSLLSLELLKIGLSGHKCKRWELIINSQHNSNSRNSRSSERTFSLVWDIFFYTRGSAFLCISIVPGYTVSLHTITISHQLSIYLWQPTKIPTLTNHFSH